MLKGVSGLSTAALSPFAGQSAVTAAALGDSLTQENGPVVTGAVLTRFNGGYLNHLDAASNGAFNWVIISGVVGDTAQQIYSRLSTVLAAKPAVLFYLAGANDAINGEDVEVTWGWMTRTVNEARAAGVRVVWVTTFPLYKLTAQTGALIGEYRRRIIDYCNTNNNVIMADAYSILIDANSATGYTKANMLRADNTHLSQKGARAVGYGLWNNTLKSIFPTTSYHVSSVTDTRAVNANSRQLITNPLMQGTAGALATGITGTITTSWQAFQSTGAPTAVGSVVARTDGIGNDQQLDITATAANDELTFRTNDSLNARVSLNDLLSGELYIALTNCVNLFRVRVWLSVAVAGVPQQSYFMESNQDVGDITKIDQADLASVPFKPWRLQLPASGAITTANLNISFTFSGAGGCTAKIGRASVIKLN